MAQHKPLNSATQKKLEMATRLHIAGDLDGAEKIYCSVQRQFPTHAQINELLGKLYLTKGNFKKAEEHFSRVLAFRPDHAECAWLNGFASWQLGKANEARKQILQSLQGNPDNIQARTLLNTIHGPLRPQVELSEITENLTQLIRLTQDASKWVLDLVCILEAAGETELAEEWIQKALERDPQPFWLLRDAMLLPAIMTSTDSIAAARRRYESRIDPLLAKGAFLELDDPITTQYFYLAFHGQNNRVLLGKLGRLLSQQPLLIWKSPHLDKRPPENRRLKVGFCSTLFVAGHSISNFCHELIMALGRRDDMDVVVFPVSTKAAGPVEVTSHHKIIPVPGGDLHAARKIIADEELDVLIYPDLGMDASTYMLAYSRLAPVQCVMLGHPDTTGVPSIDYMLSAAVYETPESDKHYTEKLVRLQHGGLHFAKPATLSSGKSRADFGFSDLEKIYFCPMALQKIHPEFDLVLREILDADPSSVIVFPKDFVQGGNWGKKLEARFDRTFSPEQRARVRFVPWQTRKEDFVALLSCVDVLLDSIHFGGGTTALLSIALGIPIVTWPGEFCRGRVVSGLLRYIGVEESIAADLQDYVKKAIFLANDPSERQRLGARIQRQGAVLFDNPAAIEEFAGALAALKAKHASTEDSDEKMAEGNA